MRKSTDYNVKEIIIMTSIKHILGFMATPREKLISFLKILISEYLKVLVNYNYSTDIISKHDY